MGKVEQADGGVTHDTDVTVDDVSPEVMDKVAAGLAALDDDPGTKDDRGERDVLDEVVGSAISAVESNVVADVDSVASTVASSAVSEAAGSVVSAAVTDAVNYDIEDNLYRAAIHQGWKPEEIETFMELDPDRARATFGKIYETNNNLSKNWAEMGRTRLSQDVPNVQQSNGDTENDGGKTIPEFKSVDIDELRKQYDNDPVVDLVAQQQEQNKVLYDAVNKLNETISTRPQVEQPEKVLDPVAAAIGSSIDAFFKQDDMKMYDTFYGTGDDLTPGDVANRQAMFELADQITAGRALQGLDTTVDEALTQAHLLVTEPIREKMVRQSIVSELKKRSNSLSLRPASKGSDTNATGVGKPKTDGDLIDVTKDRLAKVFNS
jgi:hypothetical protein